MGPRPPGWAQPFQGFGFCWGSRSQGWAQGVHPCPGQVMGVGSASPCAWSSGGDPRPQAWAQGVQRCWRTGTKGWDQPFRGIGVLLRKRDDRGGIFSIDLGCVESMDKGMGIALHPCSLSHHVFSFDAPSTAPHTHPRDISHKLSFPADEETRTPDLCLSFLITHDEFLSHSLSHPDPLPPSGASGTRKSW